MIVEELQKQVHKVLETLGVKKPEVQFEHPADLAHGDYSTNAALRYAKELKVKPRELAGKTVEKLKSLEVLKFVEKVEVAGQGFINFHLSKDFFANEVKKIVQSSSRSDLFPDLRSDLKGRKVMVEYTDPNPFKEFHIGHLMNNAVGESIARIFEFHGAKVVRACYQGDVGLHVAKAVFGAQKQIKDLRFKIKEWGVKEWGQAYALGAEKYESDETAKKEINELNKKIFDRSDKDVNALYDAGRKVSLRHFEEIYKILGTKFDYYFFEGKEGIEGVPIVEEYLKKGVFEKSEGAVVYHGEQHGLHTRVFLTKENLPTYETKELGLNKAKFEREPNLDQSLIVTANEQSDYFKVVLAAMKEVLPEVAKRTKHIAHGLLQFASGKMSSRKGNVITGESLIEQVKELVREKIKEPASAQGSGLAKREMSGTEKEKVAEIVAIGAIKYSILRQAIGGDIIFDFEKSISFEGDSGPYLQYSLTRAQSVLEKAKEVGVKPFVGVKLLQTPTTIERLLYRFPEVVERAGKEYQPHYITTFLTELAGAFNNWYAHERILDAGGETPYRLALTQAFATVMQNGLWLLGIRAPERM